MKMMMSRGGENPWEAGYSQELAQNVDKLEKEEHAISDKAEIADDGIMSKLTNSKAF